jgi:CRP/FNR family transcriptional regulator, cyclic AMP receptor protein
MGPDGAVFEKLLAGLPVVTRLAGETVVSAGLKTDLLLILKKGAVVVFKDSIEIARVAQLGAVLGELSALLDQPHTAEVRALEDSQFYVADAGLLEKEPSALLHVAKTLAQRLVDADTGLIELKKQLQAGQSSSVLGKTLERIQQMLGVGGALQGYPVDGSRIL